MENLKKLIREIPDYPKPGILFYDVTTLLKDRTGFHSLVDKLCTCAKPVIPGLMLCLTL